MELLGHAAQHSSFGITATMGWSCSFPEAGNCCWRPEGSQEAKFQPLCLGHSSRDSVGSVKPWHLVPLSTQRDQHNQRGPVGAPTQPRTRGRPGPAARSSQSPGTKRCLLQRRQLRDRARGRAMANELFHGSPGSSSAPGRLQLLSVIEPVLTHLSTSPANPWEGGRRCLPAERPRRSCQGAGKRCDSESRAGPAGAGAPATARLSAPEALTAFPGAQASSLSSFSMLQASELRLFPLR